MASDQVPGIWISISLAILAAILVVLPYYWRRLVKNVPPLIHAIILSFCIAVFFYFVANIISIACTGKWIHYGFLIGAVVLGAIIYAILIKTGFHRKFVGIEVEQEDTRPLKKSVLERSSFAEMLQDGKHDTQKKLLINAMTWAERVLEIESDEDISDGSAAREIIRDAFYERWMPAYDNLKKERKSHPEFASTINSLMNALHIGRSCLWSIRYKDKLGKSKAKIDESATNIIQQIGALLRDTESRAEIKKGKQAENNAEIIQYLRNFKISIGVTEMSLAHMLYKLKERFALKVSESEVMTAIQNMVLVHPANELASATKAVLTGLLLKGIIEQIQVQHVNPRGSFDVDYYRLTDYGKGIIGELYKIEINENIKTGYETCKQLREAPKQINATISQVSAQINFEAWREEIRQLLQSPQFGKYEPLWHGHVMLVNKYSPLDDYIKACEAGLRILEELNAETQNNQT
jgi:hypothetical protein